LEWVAPPFFRKARAARPVASPSRLGIIGLRGELHEATGKWVGKEQGVSVADSRRSSSEEPDYGWASVVPRYWSSCRGRANIR
jgi:hypothetical protein